MTDKTNDTLNINADSPYSILLKKVDDLTKRADKLEKDNSDLINFNKALLNRNVNDNVDNENSINDKAKAKLAEYLKGGD